MVILFMTPQLPKSWLDCHSNSFLEIQNIAKVPPNWKSFKKVVLNNQYKNSILKPINNYVLNLYPKPDLIYKDKGQVILRQKTHADIWLYKEPTYLYVIDRPHQRQFYPSKTNNFISKDTTFNDQFRFYIPWIFDADCTIQYVNVDGEESPFFVLNKNIKYNVIEKDLEQIETEFIPFYIYKEGKYKIDEDYGIIKCGTPAYDIIIKDKKVINKLLEIYE